MKRETPAIVAFFVLLFGLTIPAVGQTPAGTPTPTPTPTPPVDVMYTGKLLGYFRVPSLQQHRRFKGCPSTSDTDSSAAAKTFLDWRKNNSAILVSTGDNFSPQLEARIFSDPTGPGSGYIPGNKELYTGDGNDGWVFYKDLHLPQYRSLAQNIADGYGTIPTDNVGCFLRAARFDAVVPGKHDFYFGAERVRGFARFLAGTNTANGSYPVQMLGANLVLRTVPIVAQKTPSSVAEDKWFDPWPDKYPVLNLKDGGSAYPWFTYARIQLMELRTGEKPLAELAAKFSSDGTLRSGVSDDLGPHVDNIITAFPSPSSTYSQDQWDADQKELTQLKEKLKENLQGLLCESQGGPNDLPTNLSTCIKLNRQFRLAGNKIVVYLEFPIRTATGKDGHYSTLTPGKNYQLCAQLQGQSSTGCHRFSSHTPFFNFPHTHPQLSTHNYTDPDPYVLKDHVAIFGVVDPTLGEQIGILNFGWNNKEDDLTSRVGFEDPAEALGQQLDYFEKRHPNFSGLKVLLAQMNPQRARALSAKFPQFQIVVSAADQEQGTSDVETSTRWMAKGHKRAFMAVPTPYFNSSTRTGSVHFGTVRAAKDQDRNWELKAHITPSLAVAEPGDPATQFWTNMKRLPPSCLPANLATLSAGNATNQTYLKWRVLCAMRDYLAADVALIQKRDLYEKIPAFQEEGEKLLDRAKVRQAAPHHPQHIQQTLDRLIWKGDLITLLHVPGSALKKALQRSDEYVAEENATLSLAVERGRQLETLGIRKKDGEYFVNDLPLEDNKLYAVATTDYIGAGDTGYPDLVKEARNPRSHPAAFTGNLTAISSLVCRQYFLNLTQPQNPSPYCLEPIISSEYLDQTTAQRIPPHEQPGFFERTSDWVKSAKPKGITPPKTVAEGVEQTVHRRNIWRLSVQSLSFGFKGLGNNITGKEQKEEFSGIPISGVNAKESETFTLGASTRLVHSWNRREFFVASGLDYDTLSEGDSTIGISMSQRRNRLLNEVGFLFWRTPGRALPNFGVNLSLFTETQPFRPFSQFTLKSRDETTELNHRLKINGKRSWLLLPRLGIRWQGKTKLFEFGGQYGKEINAPNGYQFSDEVICTPDASVPLSKCVEDNSDPATGGIITQDSEPIILTQDRPRAGSYWKVAFSQQIVPRVKYQFEDATDFFFVNFRQDTTVDTRFRSISKHRLNFEIWPSFSIGPVLDVLIYQNKRNKDWLIQRTFSIEAKINFDIFNRREPGAQVKHKP